MQDAYFDIQWQSSFQIFIMSSEGSSSVIDLNVGGLLYTTSLDTLTKVSPHRGSRLKFSANFQVSKQSVEKSDKAEKK